MPSPGAAAPGGPIRPSTAPPPTRSAQRRSRIPWAAAALVAVLGVGAGAFALQGGGDDGDTEAGPIPSATPGTSPSLEPGAGATQPTVVPTIAPSTDETVVTPPTSGPTVTEPPVTDPPTACDAACLRAAFPFMDDGECEDVDPLPDLESNTELCLLASPSGGGTVRFRAAAMASSLDIAGYLDQLGRRTAAQVSGGGRWARDGAERGPYADFTWTAPEDPYPACRAWGEDGSEVVGWVCAADAATALELWEVAIS